MNKSILKKLPTLLAILVMAGGVQTFTSCSSDDEGGGDPSSSSVGGGGGVSSSSGGGQGGGTSSGGGGSDKGNNIGNYRTVVIGTQTWMAENLNYAVEGSKCYNNSPANCTKYGRLYNWATAMNLPSSCNSGTCSGQIQSPHQGICPSGWHIPSDDEWDILVDYAGGFSVAGSKLKATTGWDDDGNGTDQYGFSALPGGFSYSDGDSRLAGDNGYWWSATESSANGAYRRYVSFNYSTVYRNTSYKSYLFSVRCVQD